ncbi:RNA-guided endonuclease InsQ/TnpB family protein [Burkholderia ambifaria]|uniref:RNA-guided endonuclease InsQ/TnpB family protein n=1 Tax=Burkholderia ambifaria TaxID=152480 RepID=UPI00158EFF1E|nr:transposase [Burkholderia ambifaria]
MILVYRYRVKSLNGLLNKQSRAVNYVWNFCNDTLNSRALPEGKIKDGTNFAQDARGNWFLNIVIEMPDVQARPIRSGVGIDLGLKDFATLSTGEKLPNDQFGRRETEKLAKAQRARKHKRHIAKLHAKVANARADFQHKLALACGSKDSTTRPKGIAGLRMREWACDGCGVVHDRDINAALNILRCGRASPGVGITCL